MAASVSGACDVLSLGLLLSSQGRRERMVQGADVRALHACS